MKTFSEIYNEWHHLSKVDLARKVYEECKASAIPDGCVIVPKEPTDLMRNVYLDKSIAPISSLSVRGYKAMIEVGGKK